MLTRLFFLFLVMFVFSGCYVCYYSFNTKELIDTTTKIDQDEMLRFTINVNEHAHSDKLHVFLMPLKSFEIIDFSIKFQNSNEELALDTKYLDYEYLFSCPDFKKVLEESNYLTLKVKVMDKSTTKIQAKEYILFKEKSCNYSFVLH